jgi:hypothetical protein
VGAQVGDDAIVVEESVVDVDEEYCCRNVHASILRLAASAHDQASKLAGRQVAWYSRLLLSPIARSEPPQGWAGGPAARIREGKWEVTAMFIRRSFVAGLSDG